MMKSYITMIKKSLHSGKRFIQSLILHTAIHVYFLDRGFKISRFYSHSHDFMYWYCDIIETNYEKDSDTYVFTDLLADVIVKPDGNTRVVDLDELADAFERGLLSSQRMSCALRQLDDLLQAIYRDRFESLTEPLMNQIAEYESSQQKA